MRFGSLKAARALGRRFIAPAAVKLVSLTVAGRALCGGERLAGICRCSRFLGHDRTLDFGLCVA